MATKPRVSRSPAKLLELKIVLKGSQPSIWRRILVRDDMPLDWLHAVFQIAMGWTDSHLHHFIDSKPSRTSLYYGMADLDSLDESTLDERRYRVAALAPKLKAKFFYEYDFGDSWMHEVTVEKIHPTEKAFKHAICLAGKNACPPEDCGGIWGYYRLLDIISDPKHPEHAEMREWLGDGEVPLFNRDAVNARLKRLGV
jgi:hypothetical protein